jgi:hypothetical protein
MMTYEQLKKKPPFWVDTHDTINLRQALMLLAVVIDTI